MDAEAIRTLQAPLKARYRVDPASAVVTLAAEGRIGAEGIPAELSSRRGCTRRAAAAACRPAPATCCWRHWLPAPA